MFAEAKMRFSFIPRFVLRIWRSMAAVACFLSVLPVPACSQENTQTQAVIVEPILEARTSIGTLYRLRYRFEFPGQQSVRITGLGVVPAKGEHSYLAEGTPIEFVNVETGALLYRITFTNAVRLMDDEYIEMPRTNDFSEAAAYGAWRGRGSFQETARDLLNILFPGRLCLVPVPIPTTNEITWKTGYQDLKGLPPHLRAQIAVLLTFPDRGAAPTEFRLRAKVREKRSHTEWRSTVGTETRRSADAFMADLLAKLGGTVR